MKKYYKSKKEAKKAAEERNKQVFRMPKGTRHHGEFMVGDYEEWLNTY